MIDEEQTRETAWSITTLLIAAITLLIMAFLLATPAGTREVCLTKSEARQLWPKRHIYWYSREHCWSNRRGPPRGIHIDPVFPPKGAMAKEVMPDGQNSQTDNKKKPPQLGGAGLVIPTDDEHSIPEPDANGSPLDLARPFIERWYDQPWLR